MCLGIPARVIEVKGGTAIVDFGGVKREVDASLEDVEPGDYVIVHAGIVISKIDQREAEETIKLLQELVRALQGHGG